MPTVRPLERADVDATAIVLGRAFAASPGYAGILPFLAPGERAHAVHKVKRGFVQAAFRHQSAHVVVDGDRIVGASLVCAPGQFPISLAAFAWQATGCVRTGPRGVLNFLRIDRYLTRKHLREPHFYLFVLGVDPDCQGRGFGKSLLVHLNARADAAGVSCYLETDKEENVRLYRNAGYDVASDENVPGLQLRMWTMVRPIRAHRTP